MSFNTYPPPPFSPQFLNIFYKIHSYKNFIVLFAIVIFLIKSFN